MSVALVTGGAGFIGSHLVDLLVARGERVRVIDNLDPLAHPSGAQHAHVNPEAELVVADLRNARAGARALRGVDRVYHLAGVVGNGESMVNVRRAIDASCGGTATLLEQVLARRDQVRRLVLASSMVVYGEGSYRCAEHGELWPPPHRTAAQLAARRYEPLCPRCGRDAEPQPVREEQPLRPTSVYGITKRDQEELCLVLGQAYGLEIVALRYLSTYGSRQALANPYTGVAAIFAARVMSGRQPLVFEDGRQIRDLVHVSDVIRATAAAMDAPRAAGWAINVASGHRMRVGELARLVAEALGSDTGPAITGEVRAGDIRHCFADTTTAREVLGFEASVDPAEGIRELAGWAAGQRFDERGDSAVAGLRVRGLVR